MGQPRFALDTLAVHGGRATRPAGSPLIEPIFQTVPFIYEIGDAGLSHGPDRYYTRYGNPTSTAAEEALAALEGAEAAVVCSSGTAAMTSALSAIVRAGDHIVAQRQLYGGTHRFLQHWAPRWGIEVSWTDGLTPAAFASAMTPQTKLVIIESPTNPLMNVVDIAGVADVVHATSASLIVDNTFCTAVLQQPLKFGADLVVYSASKYLNGHSDVLCGAIVGGSTLIDACRDAVATLGGCLDPHAAWLLSRGLRTLGLRMERHSSNALRVAEFLRGHDAFKQVSYPWLSDHPAHHLTRRQMRAGGGMVSANIDTNRVSLFAFLRELQLFAASPSLGGVESLVGVPSLTSHAAMSTAERTEAGVSDSLIRLSVGIEAADDLIQDLTQALFAGRVMSPATT